MTTAAFKLRRIFLPYLAILNGVLLSFLALDWQLNNQSASTQGVGWVFFAPGLVTAALIGLYLRPRLMLLEEDKSQNTEAKDQGYVSFYILTLALVLFMAWQIDEYVSRRRGRVAELATIADIAAQPPARFYLLRRAYSNQRLAVYDSLINQPKGGNPTVFLRIAIPLLRNPADTLKDAHAAWLGFELSREFSRGTSKEEWDAVVTGLTQRMRAEFQAAPLDSLLTFRYLERAGNTDKDVSYRRAVWNSQALINPETPLVLYPVSAPFAERNQGQLWVLLGSYCGGVALFLLNLLVLNRDLKPQPE